MKASELVEKIQEQVALHGDCDVRVKTGLIFGVKHVSLDIKKPIHFEIQTDAPDVEPERCDDCPHR